MRPHIISASSPHYSHLLAPAPARAGVVASTWRFRSGAAFRGHPLDGPCLLFLLGASRSGRKPRRDRRHCPCLPRILFAVPQNVGRSSPFRCTHATQVTHIYARAHVFHEHRRG